MTKFIERIHYLLDVLLLPLAALLTALVAIYGFSHFDVVGRIFAIALLGLIAWASWIGYRQNRRLNDEWPVNLTILGVSMLGIVVLIFSFVR